MLPSTCSTALARGSSVEETSSEGNQEALFAQVGEIATDAARRRPTRSPANMSPVPEKKQSRSGTVTTKGRGAPVEVRDEPITERVGDEELVAATGRC